MDDAGVEYGQALEREHLLGKVSERGWVARRWGRQSEFVFHRLKCRLATKAFPLDVLFVPNVARCPLCPGWWPESATKANPS